MGVSIIPFKSIRQRKYMFAKLPKLAKKWAKKYGTKIVRSKKRNERST